MDPSRIEGFCLLIESELKPFITELSKLERPSTDASNVSYSGFKSTVDKDFFLAEREADYFDYEKTFASAFMQNVKHRLGYVLEQKVIQRYTIRPETIESTIENLNKSVLILNFGVHVLSALSRTNIINLEMATGVTPRAYLISSESLPSFGLHFNEFELNDNFEIKNSLIGKKLRIGIGKLSQGNLEDKYSDLVNEDMDLKNTIGINIGTSISFVIPESLKCVCLLEHQPYRDSKDPDSIEMNEIKRILEV
jgi:hypothetical protein